MHINTNLTSQLVYVFGFVANIRIAQCQVNFLRLGFEHMESRAIAEEVSTYEPRQSVDAMSVTHSYAVWSLKQCPPNLFD